MRSVVLGIGISLFAGASFAAPVCEWSFPNQDTELRALRNGRINLPPSFGMKPLDWKQGIDWSSFENAEATVRWHLNNFKMVRPLLMSGESDDIEMAASLIKEWWEQNPRSSPASSFAWDEHATSIRAEQIACLKSKGYDADWLTDAIEQHGEFLADPDLYQGNWNHGLDQNMGLLYLGCAAHRNDWKNLARDRSIEAITAMVDWQGVTIEQAISYHDYNYIRFLDAEAAFEACDLQLPSDVFERVEKMPDFLAHATQPDGTLVNLGDSLRGYTVLRPAGVTEFGLTKGVSGEQPRNRFGIYHAGYVFGRSGWGNDRPFEEETFYSLRYGPARIIHGHNDHTSTTYYTRGAPFLVEGGFHGYTGDVWRDHLRSPSAHNVVFTTDQANFFWNATTRLTDHRIERGWQSYRMEDAPYHQTTRSRSILFVQQPVEAVVVMDRITAPSNRNYEQAWHFDEAFSVETDGSHAVAASGAYTVDVHQLWPFDSMRVAEGEKEPIRGWSGYGMYDLRPVPALITSRSAKDATFLTVFTIRDDDAPAVITQRPLREDGIVREVTISSGGSEIVVQITSDNVLQVRP